jgi:hypothetical protein
VQESAAETTVVLKFNVPYVEWGMKNPSNFVLKVKDTVEIEIKAVAHPTNP